jgi:hypothetical protein
VRTLAFDDAGLKRSFHGTPACSYTKELPEPSDTQEKPAKKRRHLTEHFTKDQCDSVGTGLGFAARTEALRYCLATRIDQVYAQDINNL